MRTKALLGFAALAASAFIANAQTPVYSLNVVGYYNVTVPGSALQLIANQLNTTNNTLGSLLPNAPINTLFYKWVTGSGYQAYQFDEFDLVWLPNGNVTLNPGEGGLIRNPNTTPLTLTFVGEVMQGNLTNAIPAGLSIRSSMVPQGGNINDLGFPGAVNDIVYKWVHPTGYQAYQFDEFDLVWLPSVPTLSVGESMLINKVGATNWVRTFTVN